jgi:Zn-dependent protease
MVLPVPSGPRSGLRFVAFGFPVRIDLSFVIVMALLGLGDVATPAHVVLWVLIGTVSVIAHELGHAFAARRTGARPEIDLYGFGGLTRYAPPRPLSRVTSLTISVAGPLVGVVVGLALLAVARADMVSGATATYALDVAVFVNLGWGLLNLLPILPLDGGQALAELLPGDQRARMRRAALVSVPVAGAVAVVAFRGGYVFGALIAGWFAFDNVRMLAATSPAAARPLPPPGPPSTADRDLLWLVDQGRADQAGHLLATLPRDHVVDPAVRGLVLAVNGRGEQGGPLVLRACSEAPGNPLRIGVLARLFVAQHDWERLLTLASGPAIAHVPPDVLRAAEATARRSGSGSAADRIAALLEPAGGP